MFVGGSMLANIAFNLWVYEHFDDFDQVAFIAIDPTHIEKYTGWPKAMVQKAQRHCRQLYEETH